MATETLTAKQPKGLGVFEKYLTVWVMLMLVRFCLRTRSGFGPAAADG